MFKNRLLFSYGEGVEGASDVELVLGRQRFPVALYLESRISKYQT
jgi:hypothetical protein